MVFNEFKTEDLNGLRVVILLDKLSGCEYKLGRDIRVGTDTLNSSGATELTVVDGKSVYKYSENPILEDEAKSLAKALWSMIADAERYNYGLEAYLRE